ARGSAEQRVAVLAALVGELRDRLHALIVVVLDLAEVGPHPARRALAERLRDVALLPRRLDALVAEDRRHAGEHRNLGEDVGRRVGEALLSELRLDDVLTMLPQQ